VCGLNKNENIIVYTLCVSLVMVILFTVSLAVMRLPAIRLLPLVSADITVRGRGGYTTSAEGQIQKAGKDRNSTTGKDRGGREKGNGIE
jgi:hypothetical protein